MAITAEFSGFDYENSDIVAEIKKNVSTILSVTAGTVPGERELGLDSQYIGYPTDVARNLIAIDITEKVAEFEPRAEVMQVDGTPDENGQMTFTVRIGPNPEYTEEDAEADEEEAETEEEEEE